MRRAGSTIPYALHVIRERIGSSPHWSCLHRLALLLALLGAACGSDRSAADWVLRGGRLQGRQATSPGASAIAIAEDRIIAVGGSGGARIISATLQVIVAIVDFGMSPAAAVRSPRIHHQWRPHRLEVESAIPAETRSALAERGHTIKPRDSTTAVQVAEVGAQGIDGAADWRKGGKTSSR